MTTKKTPIDPKNLEFYNQLVNSLPNIERKGATMPYTSLNGNMFSFLAKDGSLGLRLPKEEREAFLEKYQTHLCEAHGTIMKEYVHIPVELLSKTEELKPYYKMSHEYTKTLKPKPPKSKKS